MQAPPSQWLHFVLAHAAFGSVVASGIYFSLRAIEKWNHENAELINLLVVVCLLIMLGVWAFPAVCLAFLVLVLGGGSGAGFHLKSGGASVTSGQARLLMGTATLLTIIIGALVLSSVPFRLPRRPPPYPNEINDYLDILLLFVPVILAPLFLWAYQSSRLRPGIDRHLHEGEEAELAL